MSFSLAELVRLLTQLTLDHQAHDLVKDHSLDFYSLQWVLSTSVRTAHVGRHMLPTQHVIARFIAAADRVSQNVEADAAGERILCNTALTFLNLFSLDRHGKLALNDLSHELLFIVFDRLDDKIGFLERLDLLFLRELIVQLSDIGGASSERPRPRLSAARRRRTQYRLLHFCYLFFIITN